MRFLHPGLLLGSRRESRRIPGAGVVSTGASRMIFRDRSVGLLLFSNFEFRISIFQLPPRFFMRLHFSTFNLQPSTFNFQLSTVNLRRVFLFSLF
jgi:hypothetical protein